MSQTLPRRSNPGDVVDMHDIPRLALAKAILGCEAGGVRNAASSVGTTLRCCAVSPNVVLERAETDPQGHRPGVPAALHDRLRRLPVTRVDIVPGGRGH